MAANQSNAAKRRGSTRKREAEAARLMSMGWTLPRIGVRLAELEGLPEPISPSAVREMLKRVRARTEVAAREYVVDAAYQQLAQLEYIVEEAMEAWRMSKEPTKSATKSVATRPGRLNRETGEIEEQKAESTSTTVSDQDGNTAYLGTAMSAMERIGKLLGFAGDQQSILQVHLHGRATNGVTDAAFDEMSEADVRKYLTTMSEAAMLVAGGQSGDVIEGQVLSIEAPAAPVEPPAGLSDEEVPYVESA